MTPLELTILIHHVTCAGKHDSVSVGTDVYNQGLAMLLGNGLLEKCDRYDSGYAGTTKGKYYLEYLCSVPFPVQKLEIPTPPTIEDE